MIDQARVEAEVVLHDLQPDPDTKYGFNEDFTEMLITADMYQVGDRLLDGVSADIRIDTAIEIPTVIEATWTEDSQDYMQKLNEDHWRKEIIEQIQKTLNEIAEQGQIEEVFAWVGRLDDDRTLTDLEW